MRISSLLWSLIIPLFLSGCDKAVTEKVTSSSSAGQKPVQSSVSQAPGKSSIPQHLDAEFYLLEYDKDIQASSGGRSRITSYGPHENPSKVSLTMDSGNVGNRYRVTVDFTGTKGDQDAYRLTIAHSEDGAEKTSVREVTYSGEPVEIWTHKNVHVGVMPYIAKK
jgi:hypothetical protein